MHDTEGVVGAREHLTVSDALEVWSGFAAVWVGERDAWEAAAVVRWERITLWVESRAVVMDEAVPVLTLVFVVETYSVMSQLLPLMRDGWVCR